MQSFGNVLFLGLVGLFIYSFVTLDIKLRSAIKIICNILNYNLRERKTQSTVVTTQRRNSKES